MKVVVTIPGVLPDKTRVAIAQRFLDVVVATNRILIRRGLVPGLYESGCLYKREPPGEESFVDALSVMKNGGSDCSNLAAWLVAEMQVRLENAINSGQAPADTPMPNIRLYMRKKARVVHVQIRHSNGRIEDPSRFLGMVPSGE